MKAKLELELIGYDTDCLMASFHKLHQEIKSVPDIYKNCFKPMAPSGWVAEITGLSDKYKYNRKFLKSKKDFSRANRKGSRGVYAEFILDSGKVYEIRNNKLRYFCIVDEHGNINEVDESFLIDRFGTSSNIKKKNKIIFSNETFIEHPAFVNFGPINNILTESQIEYLRQKIEASIEEATKCVRHMKTIEPEQTIVNLQKNHLVHPGFLHSLVGYWDAFKREISIINFCLEIYNMYGNKKPKSYLKPINFLEGCQDYAEKESW